MSFRPLSGAHDEILRYADLSVATIHDAGFAFCVRSFGERYCLSGPALLWKLRLTAAYASSNTMLIVLADASAMQLFQKTGIRIGRAAE